MKHMRQTTDDGGNGLFVVVMALCSSVIACSTHVPFSVYDCSEVQETNNYNGDCSITKAVSLVMFTSLIS